MGIKTIKLTRSREEYEVKKHKHCWHYYGHWENEIWISGAYNRYCCHENTIQARKYGDPRYPWKTVNHSKQYWEKLVKTK